MEIELQATRIEGIADLHGHVDGVLADAEIQVVRKQRVELQAEQAALGQQRAVLFGNGGEISRHVVLCKDCGLAEQRADLRAADVEHVAQLGQLRQGNVALRAHQTVAEACAVDVEWDIVPAADAGQLDELTLGVERAELRRVGDVDHAGIDKMLVTRILPVVLHIHPDILGAELAVVDGQGDDLVAREFDGAGLVVADVAGLRGDHAAVGRQHGVDDDGVRLRAADHEENVGAGTVTGRADLFLCALAVFVAAVAGELLQIRLVQTAQDLYPRARSIIALKRMHSCHSCGNQPVITARAFFARLSAVQLQV